MANYYGPDRTRATYDVIAEEYAMKTRDLHPSDASDVFLSMIGRCGRILDLGSGPGRDSLYFASMGYPVVAVDFSGKMAFHAKWSARNAGAAAFTMMDLRSLGFSERSFDGVWANASLLHLPKLEVISALAEIARVAKNGAAVYISVKAGCGEGLEPDSRYGGLQKYYSYYTENEISGMIESADMRIEKIWVEMPMSGYNVYPFINVIAIKNFN